MLCGIHLCFPCLRRVYYCSNFASLVFTRNLFVANLLSILQYYISFSKEKLHFVSIINCNLQLVNFEVNLPVSSVALFFLLRLFNEYNENGLKLIYV
jgi:hypothetical protein